MSRVLPCVVALVMLSTAFAAAAEERSRYVPAGYVEVFGDEFDGGGLDVDKWWTRYVYENGTLDHLKDNGEMQRYRENGNHKVGGGTLKLVANMVAPSGGNPSGIESGMLRSKKIMKYGYYEMRAKMPSGRGVWAAFWLNSSKASNGGYVWPPEIDIVEYPVNEVEEKPTFMHSNVLVRDSTQGGELLAADRAFNRQWNYIEGRRPWSDDFHVYGALWDVDDTVSFFIDGKLIQKRAYRWANAGATPGFAHVLLNLAIGGQPAGKFGIDPPSAFPKQFEIDYVRVYQRPDRIMVQDDPVGDPRLCRAPGTTC
ncbi:MAG: family 16 glycosylhydrolase [Gemmatimonas sp.]